MKSMFGGKPKGGFFDLPLLTPGDTADTKIVLMGAPGATPYSSVGNYCADALAAIRSSFGWPGVLGHHDFDIDGYLLPDNIKAIDWGNLDYSETDFSARCHGSGRDRARTGWLHLLANSRNSASRSKPGTDQWIQPGRTYAERRHRWSWRFSRGPCHRHNARPDSPTEIQ
jgi:hypothetical protein